MMQEPKQFLDMFIFDKPQASMEEAKDVFNPTGQEMEDRLATLGSIGSIAADAMQMNKMNGMFRGDTGELSQGAQQLAQKVNENEKTGILQRTAEFFQNLIQPFPGDVNDPRDPMGTKLIKGPDGKLYNEELIKMLGGFDMQELERRRKILGGK